MHETVVGCQRHDAVAAVRPRHPQDEHIGHTRNGLHFDLISMQRCGRHVAIGVHRDRNILIVHRGVSVPVQTKVENVRALGGREHRQHQIRHRINQAAIYLPLTRELVEALRIRNHARDAVGLAVRVPAVVRDIVLPCLRQGERPVANRVVVGFLHDQDARGDAVATVTTGERVRERQRAGFRHTELVIRELRCVGNSCVQRVLIDSVTTNVTVVDRQCHDAVTAIRPRHPQDERVGRARDGLHRH